jgi:hypothetical protein
MYGVITPVPAPVELYDRVHAELRRRTDGKVEGLLVHIGRATSDGFEVLEVWESREQFERYAQELIDPTLAEVTSGQAPPTAQSAVEFEVRGLVLPSAGIYH